MKRYFPAIIWALIILVLSAYPGNQLPKVAVWQFDKLVHSLIYGGLSFLLLLAFHKVYAQKDRRIKTIVGVVLLSVFYGGVMEILQHYIFINRSGNWYDFMANTVGAIGGVLSYPLVAKLLPFNSWFKIK